MSNKISFSILSVICVSLIILSCTKEASSSSEPNFIFKNIADKTLVAKMGSESVTTKEMSKGIEVEIYETEMKLYDLKMAKIKSIIIEKLMNADPNKKGLSNDQYMEKYIASSIKISKEEIEKFIAERKIPQEHLNDQMREKIEQYLKMEKQKSAIDSWLATKTQSNPVEIYITKPERPVFDVKTDKEDPSFGPSDAKVTLVEFSDFQCPFCAKGALILKELKKKYGSKIRVIFKNYPLPFHQDAKMAAVAGLCANEQGSDNFWKLHDEMFANQQKLGLEDLKAHAKKISLDMAKFETCLNNKEVLAAVESDIVDGKSAMVKSTPTFFVNGKLINGAVPVEQFSQLIDSELKK